MLLRPAQSLGPTLTLRPPPPAHVEVRAEKSEEEDLIMQFTESYPKQEEMPQHDCEELASSILKGLKGHAKARGYLMTSMEWIRQPTLACVSLDVWCVRFCAGIQILMSPTKKKLLPLLPPRQLTTKLPFLEALGFVANHFICKFPDFR